MFYGCIVNNVAVVVVLYINIRFMYAVFKLSVKNRVIYGCDDSIVLNIYAKGNIVARNSRSIHKIGYWRVEKNYTISSQRYQLSIWIFIYA